MFFVGGKLKQRAHRDNVFSFCFFESESHRCKSLLSASCMTFRRQRYEDAASKTQFAVTFPYVTVPASSPAAGKRNFLVTKAQSHSAASPASCHELMFMDPHPSVPFAVTRPR